MATRLSQTSKRDRAAGAKTIKLSPRRALAKVRKGMAPPTRIEDFGRYRREEERRGTREIVVDEIEGC